MSSFECRMQIDAPPVVVFDLARDIDAHLRSQQKARERAIAGTTSGLIGPGESVTWRATHFGVPFRMTSHIVEFESPRWFVDEQVSGPFRRFRHEHLFDPSANGTTMIDRVQFDAPVGFIGALVDRAFLGGYLRQLIENRAKALKTEAEARS